MKLLNRLKYKIFVWLMGDICDKSQCEYCEFGCYCEIAGESGLACTMNDAHVQARKVWGLEETSE